MKWISLCKPWISTHGTSILTWQKPCALAKTSSHHIKRIPAKHFISARGCQLNMNISTVFFYLNHCMLIKLYAPMNYLLIISFPCLKKYYSYQTYDLSILLYCVYIGHFINSLHNTVWWSLNTSDDLPTVTGCTRYWKKHSTGNWP